MICLDNYYTRQNYGHFKEIIYKGNGTIFGLLWSFLLNILGDENQHRNWVICNKNWNYDNTLVFSYWLNGWYLVKG